MRSEPRWEPPLAEPLLVTLRRAAEILDMPAWRTFELAFCLDARYFGPLGGAIRVTMASVREYEELRDAGEPAHEILIEKYGPGRQQYKPDYSLELLSRMTRSARNRASYRQPSPTYWERQRSQWWRH